MCDGWRSIQKKSPFIPPPAKIEKKERKEKKKDIRDPA